MISYQEGGFALALFLTGLAAFIGGCAVSWVNFLFLRRLMKSKGDTGAALASPIRMILSAAYLVLLYLIGKNTALSLTALLVGGALGLTAALAFFTIRLSRNMGKE